MKTNFKGLMVAISALVFAFSFGLSFAKEVGEVEVHQPGLPEGVEVHKPEAPGEAVHKPEDVRLHGTSDIAKGKVEIEKIEKVEKAEKVNIERPEKANIEKPEKIEIARPERVDRPERVERVEVAHPEIERPERVDRPEVNRPEVERPERVDVERPEGERGGRGRN